MLIHYWLSKRGGGGGHPGEGCNDKEAEGGGGTKGKSVGCKRYFGKRVKVYVCLCVCERLKVENKDNE